MAQEGAAMPTNKRKASADLTCRGRYRKWSSVFSRLRHDTGCATRPVKPPPFCNATAMPTPIEQANYGSSKRRTPDPNHRPFLGIARHEAILDLPDHTTAI